MNIFIESFIEEKRILELWPSKNDGMFGNVLIAILLKKIFTEIGTILIFINSFLSTIFTYFSIKLMKRLSFKKCDYLIFIYSLNPISLEWTLQNLKDGYSNISWVLLAYFSIKSYKDKNVTYKNLVSFIASLLLIIFVRPHYFKLFIALSFLIYLPVILKVSIKQKASILSVLLLTLISNLSLPTQFYEKQNYAEIKKQEDKCQTWKWDGPSFIFPQISKIRYAHVCTIPSGSSSVLQDEQLKNMKDFVKLFPPILLVSLIDIDPRVLTKINPVKAIAASPFAIISYLFVFLFTWCFIKRKFTIELFYSFTFLIPIILFAYMFPNYGHLLRVKFSFYIIFMIFLMSHFKRVKNNEV